ncbi:hypothetical protein EGW08_013064, partial [Elysia chlorotica]
MELEVHLQDDLASLEIPQAATGDEGATAIIKLEPISESVVQRTGKFQKGECYTSFEEFISVLHQYQQQNNVFFVRDSAERLKFDGELVDRLVYKYCLFSCKQGKKKKDKGSVPKIRPNQSSFKVGCKAFIRLGLKQQLCGEYVLEVKSSNLEHINHPITAENAFKYPENRRVQVNEKLKSVIISPKSKPKQVLEYIKKDQAKTLSSRDLYNLKRKLQQDEKPCAAFPSQ